MNQSGGSRKAPQPVSEAGISVGEAVVPDCSCLGDLVAAGAGHPGLVNTLMKCVMAITVKLQTN